MFNVYREDQERVEIQRELRALRNSCCRDESSADARITHVQFRNYVRGLDDIAELFGVGSVRMRELHRKTMRGQGRRRQRPPYAFYTKMRPMVRLIEVEPRGNWFPWDA